MSEGGELAGVVRRNIRALIAARTAVEQQRSGEDRVADAITRFTGSMRFVYLHALLFGGWLVVNLGWVPRVRPFDPFPFVMLAMIASVEAIFLSTFVLISQNRMSQIADRRADLDLQINLLAEHEITRLLEIADAIAERVGVPHPEKPPHIDELKRDVEPGVVLEELEQAARERREAER